MASSDKGIVVWKEQHFHNDDRARAFVFDRMQAHREITWFWKDSKRIGFEKHHFFQYIILPPTLPTELAEPEQIASYRQHFTELDAFARRFSSAARLLKPQLEVMKGAIADCEAGQVCFSGQWMPRADYETKVAARDKLLREKAALREAARREESQRRQIIEREEARRRQVIEREEGRRYTYAYGSGLVLYLMVLVTAAVRQWRSMMRMLILAPLLAAGWMTYRHGGHGWINQHAEKISRVWKSPDMP